MSISPLWSSIRTASITLCCGVSLRASAQTKAAVDTGCAATWRTIDAASRIPPALETSIDHPQLAVWRDDLLVFGDPAVRWNVGGSETDATLIEAGVWSAAGRKSVISAVGNRLPIYPSAAVTADGRLHVLYGTIRDLAHRQWTTAPDTLWHTEFDGIKWSAPQPLPPVPNAQYWWDGLSPSHLVADGSSLTVAVPVKSRDTISVVLYTRDAAGTWHEHPLVAGDVAAYVRLARTHDSLVVAWSGPDPSVPVDRASIFAKRSTDAGATWTKPTRLFFAGESGTTYDTALLMSPSGLGFVLWAQKSPIPGHPLDSIGLAETRDFGATWTPRDALGVPDGFGIGTMRAVLSQIGPMVFFDPIHGGHTQAAILRHGKWHTLAVSPGPIPFNGTVTPIAWPEGSITLVASAIERTLTGRDSIVRPRPVTRLVRLNARCSD